jgi:hypothetical protein
LLFVSSAFAALVPQLSTARDAMPGMARMALPEVPAAVITWPAQSWVALQLTAPLDLILVIELLLQLPVTRD